MHVHSGGWHLGTLETEEPFCAYLCASLSKRKPPGFAVLDVCYRHTPESIFPTQLEDVYASIDYLCGEVLSPNNDHGIDAARIFLEGTSAGAHIAIGCALRDANRIGSCPEGERDTRRRIRGLVLTCPPTVHLDLFPYPLIKDKAVASYEQNGNDPMLGTARAKIFWDMFLPPDWGSDAQQQLEISPLVASKETFNADTWPPTSFHVAGSDCLRDEGLLFEEKLRAAGVKTQLQVYKGFPHAFNMLPQLKESRKWRENLLRYLIGDF